MCLWQIKSLLNLIVYCMPNFNKGGQKDDDQQNGQSGLYLAANKKLDIEPEDMVKTLEVILNSFTPEIRAKFGTSIEFIADKFKGEWLGKVPATIMNLSKEELNHYLLWLKAIYSCDERSKRLVLLPLNDVKSNFLFFLAGSQLFYEGRYVGESFNLAEFKKKLQANLNGTETLLFQKLKIDLDKGEFMQAFVELGEVIEFQSNENDWDYRKFNAIAAGNIVALIGSRIPETDVSITKILNLIPSCENWQQFSDLGLSYKDLEPEFLRIVVNRLLWKFAQQKQTKTVGIETFKDVLTLLFSVAHIKYFNNVSLRGLSDNEKGEIILQERNRLFKELLIILEKNFGFSKKATESIYLNLSNWLQSDTFTVPLNTALRAFGLLDKKAVLTAYESIKNTPKEQQLDVPRCFFVKRLMANMALDVNDGKKSKSEYGDYLKILAEFVDSETSLETMMDVWWALRNFGADQASQKLIKNIRAKILTMKGGFEMLLKDENASVEMFDRSILNLEELCRQAMESDDTFVAEKSRYLWIWTLIKDVKHLDPQEILMFLKKVFLTRNDVFQSKNLHLVRTAIGVIAKTNNKAQELFLVELMKEVRKWNLNKEELRKLLYVVAVDSISEELVEKLISENGSVEVEGGSEAWPQRDIAGLITEIVANRSSHISSDGHVLLFTDKEYDSPLSARLKEIRIKRNSETGNPAKGVACNVVVYFKPAQARYFKLTVEGDLVERILDPKSGRELAQKNKSELGYGINELHYLILQKLKVVYVRRSDRPAPMPVDTVKNELDNLPVEPEKTEPVIEPESNSTDEVKSGDENVVVPEAQSEAVIVPGSLETMERLEGEVSVDLTGLDKKEIDNLKRLDRVRSATNRARVYGVFAPLLHGQELPETMSLPVGEEVVLYEKKTYRNGPRKGISLEHYERVVDVNLIYQKVRKGEFDVKNLFVRKSRAHVRNLPLKVEEKRVDDIPDGKIYYGFKNNQEMSEQASEKMELFTIDEQAEELKINNQKRILTYKVLDTSKPGLPSEQRAMFEKIRSGSLIREMANTAQLKIKVDFEEQRKLLRAKYLEVLEPDLLGFSEEMQNIVNQAREQLNRELEAIKELPARCVEEKRKVVAADGSVRDVSILHLPEYGYEIRQTFSSGQFQSVGDLLESFKVK